MKFIAIALCCLSFASCTSVKAHADFEAGVDFSAFKTFALAAPPAKGPVALPSYSEIRGRAINNKIAEYLLTKGYTQSDETNADLIVSFQLAGEARQDVRSTGTTGYSSFGRHGWYGSPWYNETVYTVSYVEGTLIVDAFDRAAEQVIWHGWSTVGLYSQADAYEKEQLVIEAVMAQFPACSLAN